MPDADIWTHAAAEGAVIVSKDRDFLDLAAVRGTPPVVLLVGVGKVSTSGLLVLLDEAWPTLARELASPDAGIVTLERECVVVVRRS